MPRTFTNGASSRVNLALGAGAGLSGAFALAAITKAGSDAITNPGLVTVGAGQGGGRWVIFIGGPPGNALGLYGGGAALMAPTINVKAADGWILVLGSKTAGASGVIRFHKYVYSTNTWTHENSASTSGNGTPAGSSAIGANTDGSGAYTGDIALAGAYAAVPTDAQVESMAFDLNAWWWIQPNGLWLLDQSSTSMKVIDLTGNGANETGITGTAVGTSAVPVFSYGAPIADVRTVSAVTHNASLTIAANGACAYTGLRKPQASCAISGGGVIAAAGLRAANASLAVSGSGALAGGGSRAVNASAGIAANGTFAYGAQRTANASLAITGSGAFAYAGQRAVAAAVTIAGSGAFTVAGLRSVTAALAVTGSGSSSYGGSRAVNASAGINGSAILAYAARKEALAVLAILGVGTFAFEVTTPVSGVSGGVHVATSPRAGVGVISGPTGGVRTDTGHGPGVGVASP